MKKMLIKMLALLCAATTTLGCFSGCFQSETPTTETPPVETPSPEPEPEPEPEPDPVANILLTDFETPFDSDDKYYTNYNHVKTYEDVVREQTDKARVEYYQMKTDAISGDTKLLIVVAGGWEGPYWLGGNELPFTTNTFTFVSDSDLASKGMSLYVCYRNEENKRVEELATIDYENKLDLGLGEYRYTATISTPISKIWGFEFSTKGYYIDDIYAINTEMEQPEYIAPYESMIDNFETDFDDPTLVGEDNVEYINYGTVNPWHYIYRESAFKWYSYTYEGTNRVFQTFKGNGWEGPVWMYPGFELLGATQYFKVKVKGLTNDFKAEMYYFAADGTKYTAEDVTVIAKEDLGDGWTEFTFATSAPVLRVVSAIFKTYTNNSYYVDDFRALYLGE